MKKQKSHKGLGKRVKLTASGKIKYKRSCGGHLMSGKKAKRRRRIAGFAFMNATMAQIAKTRLGK